jgi:hypothetical protein
VAKGPNDSLWGLPQPSNDQKISKAPSERWVKYAEDSWTWQQLASLSPYVFTSEKKFAQNNLSTLAPLRDKLQDPRFDICCASTGQPPFKAAWPQNSLSQHHNAPGLHVSNTNARVSFYTVNVVASAHANKILAFFLIIPHSWENKLPEITRFLAGQQRLPGTC